MLKAERVGIINCIKGSYFRPTSTFPVTILINMHQVLAVLCLASAVVAQYGGGHDDHKVVDYYAVPHYKFHYSVNDPHTYDIKKQEEERKDDDVKGYYSLHEPDGTVREVHYTSDKKNGFNAVVHRSGHAQHPQKYGASREAYYGHGGLGGGHGGLGGGEGGASSSYSFDGHY